MKTFDPKRPAEEVTLTFDFSAECPAPRTLVSCSASLTQESGPAGAGIDAMLVGSAVIQGALVLQRVAGGVLECDYQVVAQVVRDDGEIRELPGLLRVRKWTA